MNNSAQIDQHFENVIKAMRDAMAKVPKEYQHNVTARLYLTIGKRYHKQ